MVYPGSKNGAGVHQRIINLMPPHSVYIEPFLGSGTILRLKRPASKTIGIDLDKAALKLTLNKCNNKFPAYIKLIQGDGIAFLENHEWTGKELIYCDPPYLLETRRRQTRIYKHEFTVELHEQLLDIVLDIPVPVLISGYWSELYAQKLKGWSFESFNAATRGGTAKEFVWYNYAPPLELHDYRFLGKSFRERERIKRKQNRWKGRLERMPPLERHAIFAAIQEMRESPASSKLTRVQ